MFKGIVFIISLFMFAGCSQIFKPFYGFFQPAPKQQHFRPSHHTKPPAPEASAIVPAPEASAIVPAPEAKQPSASPQKPRAMRDDLLAMKAKSLGLKRIAFVGDSHFAGDFLEQRFKDIFGIYSLGFMPPALPKYHRQALINYHNLNIKINYLINSKNLDFGGIDALCLSSCTLKLDLKFYARRPKVLINSSLKSLPAGNSLQVHASAGDQIGGFISGNDEFIDNLGINGASVLNYKRIKDSNIAALLNYDLVIFSFGTNEAVASKIDPELLKTSLAQIFNRFKGAKKLLLLPPEPVLYHNGAYELGKSTDAVFAAFKQIAKEQGVLVFNTRELERKEGGRSAWMKAKLSQANTHLSPKGYYYLADKLIEFLAAHKDEF